MQPIVKLDRTLVAVEVDQTVHVMLELVAPPAPIAGRAPIDVVAVLDRSGSMSGAPLDAVLAATNMLVRLLDADDRIAVVTFDDRVDMVLPLSHHNPAAAEQALAGVGSGGSTNLSGGWLKGLEILSAHGRPGAVKRILVLTDGQANAGIVDPDALCGLASAAKGQRITTTMVGFGDAFDERLLAAMADAGGGNDYWCAGVDQAPQVFSAEFAGLASVVAQNISAEIRPTDAAANCLVLNEYPITAVDGGMQVALGDAYGGECRRVIAMFELQAADQPGPVPVGDLVIRWVNTIGQVALHTVTVPVMVGAAAGVDIDTVAPDPEVTEQVNVLKVARARKDAHEAAGRGDYAAASQMLAAALPAFEASGVGAAELDELRRDAVRLAADDWHGRDMKRTYSTMRSERRGRKQRFDDPGEVA